MRHRILLISSTPALVERLKDALQPDAVVMPADPLAGEVMTLAEQFQPDGIVFDAESPLGVHTLFERAAAARKNFPELPLVVIGNAASAQLVLAAMRAGADDFLDGGSGADDMRSAILARLDAPPRRSEGARGALVGILTSAGAEEDQDFALNLSCLLAARRAPGRVLLLDLSLPASIASVALGIPVSFGLQDAIRAMNRFDEALLESVLARCPRSGLFVLPLAPQAESTEAALDVQDVQALLHILRGFFDAVVIFYGPFSRQEQLADFAHTDARLVLCCNQRLSSVKAAAQLLRRVREARPHAPAPLVLIHAFAAGLAPNTEAVCAALGVDDCVVLRTPWEGLAWAVNRGVPLVLSGPSAYGRGIGECLDRLQPPAGMPARGGAGTAKDSILRRSWPFGQKRRA